MACVCPLSFLSIVLPVFVLCPFCPFEKKQRTNTGNTMDRKDKGQTQAI
jgi:hypothetical protein